MICTRCTGLMQTSIGPAEDTGEVEMYHECRACGLEWRDVPERVVVSETPGEMQPSYLAELRARVRLG